MLFRDLPIGAKFRLTESVLPALVWVKVDAEHASAKGRRERWIQEDAKVSKVDRDVAGLTEAFRQAIDAMGGPITDEEKNACSI